MTRRSRTTEIYKRGLSGIVVCIIIFIFGLNILNDLFNEDELPEEINLLTIAGIALILLSIFGTFVFINYMYSQLKKYKRKKYKSRRFYDNKDPQNF